MGISCSDNNRRKEQRKYKNQMENKEINNTIKIIYTINNDKHSINIPLILLTLLIFHFEISGKDDNDEHTQNIKFILVTLLVFHFEISGKDDNDEHPPNILLILVILSIPFNIIFSLLFFFLLTLYFSVISDSFLSIIILHIFLLFLTN